MIDLRQRSVICASPIRSNSISADIDALAFWSVSDLAWVIGFVSGVSSRSVGAERQVGEHWDSAASLVWLD
jgi:hypothetical protein